MAKGARALFFAASALIFLLLIASARGYSVPSQPTRASASKASQFLAPHNAARKALGIRPLVWDARLERYAQRWASERKYDCELEHSSGPYGENIFWGSGVGWTPAQAVSAWVAERSRYVYWSNSCRGGAVCGHYTQIVWRETRRIGCASVTCSGGKGTFMTCNYDPPGNYVGERPY